MQYFRVLMEDPLRWPLSREFGYRNGTTMPNGGGLVNETVSVRGMTRAVEQDRQLLPPVEQSSCGQSESPKSKNKS